MIVTKAHLPRRTFLRSALGAAVALPFLDAMVPALSAQDARRPLRFGAVYLPNGVQPEAWHPEPTGGAFEFRPIMKPLEPYRESLVTISGLKAPDGNPENGGVHMGASAAWLNGVGPLTGQGDFSVIRSEKSLDQFIADAIAGDTPLRSLQVGTEDMGTSAGACDGYPCVFFNTLSWRDATSPLPMGINPRVTFERMFGGTGSEARRASDLALKRSVLDSIVEETAELQRSLGPADNAILDEYLTDVREVERQLDRMEARAGAVPSDTSAPSGIPDAFDEHLTVTYDLMRLAFEGDISRVFTFMVGHEGSSRSYAHIGIPEPHHPVSHHLNRPAAIEKYVRIAAYHSEKLAEFLGKLQAREDGDGTLLDRSLIYYGSGMGNGNTHDRGNPPALIAGGANGRLQGNRHIAAESGEPTANLLLGLADLMNVEIDTIGRSTRRFAL